MVNEYENMKLKIRPTRAWAIVKLDNLRLDANNVFRDKDVIVYKDEIMIPIIITYDEKNSSKAKVSNERGKTKR